MKCWALGAGVWIEEEGVHLTNTNNAFQPYRKARSYRHSPKFMPFNGSISAAPLVSTKEERTVRQSSMLTSDLTQICLVVERTILY